MDILSDWVNVVNMCQNGCAQGAAETASQHANVGGCLTAYTVNKAGQDAGLVHCTCAIQYMICQFS